MSGSATLATARFRLATAATRISAVRTTVPCFGNGGLLKLSGRRALGRQRTCAGSAKSSVRVMRRLPCRAQSAYDNRDSRLRGGGRDGAARNGATPADALVIFGITGDLAKVMTFHSLYRLEQRGLLDCPIVGVAAQDWTVEQLRDHARECIVNCGETIDDEVFNRFAARLSYVAGDFADDETYEHVGAASRTHRRRSSIWRSRRSSSGA